MNYVDAVEEFLLDCEVRNLSEKTISNYKRILLGIGRWHQFEYDVSNIENYDISFLKKWIIYMQKEGKKTSYINTNLKIFKVYWKFLIENEFVKVNIVQRISLLREEIKLSRSYTDDEVKYLIKFYDKKGFLNQRNKTIIELMADCGLRVSEVRSLREEDIYDEFIKVKGKGKKERIIPLSPYMKLSLKKYKRVKKGYLNNLRKYRVVESFLFITKSGYEMKSNSMIEIVVKKASLFEVENCKHPLRGCHGLRHYYAQKLLLEGINLYTISKLLGHNNIRTTQIYLEGVVDERLVSNMANTSPLMQLIYK